MRKEIAVEIFELIFKIKITDSRTFDMTIYKLKFLPIMGIFVFFVCLLWGWRAYTLWRLPFDEVQIPSVSQEEKLEIPPRPGIQGILITGPVIEPLRFTIDLSKAGIRSLNWRQLQTVDPYTDVKVSCHIDDQGRLVFSQADLLMEGHTEAGMMIQRALKTWMYTPYKTGTIRFWFNLPSKGKKLVIDIIELKRKDDIPEHIPIYDGQIHLIDGIPINHLYIVKK